MFWNKKKKTQLEILIEKDGLDHAASRMAEFLNEKIPSYRVAKQFVLEELDAARHGNSDALKFVQSSGFQPNEYIGAMKNSFKEVDGPEGPQLYLSNLLMSQLMEDKDLMTSFRIEIVYKIMQIWNLGKYQNESIN